MPFTVTMMTHTEDSAVPAEIGHGRVKGERHEVEKCNESYRHADGSDFACGKPDCLRRRRG